MFYPDKMPMLSSCAPAQFKCQSDCLAHSSSVQFVQIVFGDERRWFGFVSKLLCLGLYSIFKPLSRVTL